MLLRQQMHQQMHQQLYQQMHHLQKLQHQQIAKMPNKMFSHTSSLLSGGGDLILLDFTGPC